MWLRGHFPLCSAWIAAIARQMTEIFFIFPPASLTCCKWLQQLMPHKLQPHELSFTAPLWLNWGTTPSWWPLQHSAKSTWQLSLVVLSRHGSVAQARSASFFSSVALSCKAQQENWTKHTQQIRKYTKSSQNKIPSSTVLWLQRHIAVKTAEKLCLVCTMGRNYSPLQIFVFNAKRIRRWLKICEPLVDCCTVFVSVRCHWRHPCLDALQGFYVYACSSAVPVAPQQPVWVTQGLEKKSPPCHYKWINKYKLKESTSFFM